MPFQNDRPWHILFYRLKEKAAKSGGPQFLSDLWFDWDGAYPKARELTEFLQALHWTASVGVVNPHYDAIVIPKDVAALWSESEGRLDPKSNEFLGEAVSEAAASFTDVSDGVYADA